MKLFDSLHVGDPFLLPNSAAVVKSKGELHNGTFEAFSIVVEDLCFSMPQEAVMNCVKNCIMHDNDDCSFTSMCGMSLNSFLELLSFYLASTTFDWNVATFTQKSGVCIGLK